MELGCPRSRRILPQALQEDEAERGPFVHGTGPYGSLKVTGNAVQQVDAGRGQASKHARVRHARHRMRVFRNGPRTPNTCNTQMTTATLMICLIFAFIDTSASSSQSSTADNHQGNSDESDQAHVLSSWRAFRSASIRLPVVGGNRRGLDVFMSQVERAHHHHPLATAGAAQPL